MEIIISIFSLLITIHLIGIKNQLERIADALETIEGNAENADAHKKYQS